MRWRQGAILIPLIAALASGCGDAEPDDGTSAGGGGSGGSTPFEPPCADLQVPFAGECVSAGVPPDGCAPGFVHDGDGSCDPVVPHQPCPPGQVALPGESSCRPLGECGTEPWGDIPVEPNTQYVDQAYGGNDSDGTSSRPWHTITEGIDAAEPGAIVAIAAGSYAEALLIIDVDVRLWGRCSSLVEIDGGAEQSTMLIGQGTSELHQLAVVGQGVGVGIAFAEALLDRVWIHDTGSAGLQLQNDYGPVTAVVDGSLIEGATRAGILLLGGEIAVEETVVRDVRAGYDGLGGRALEVQRSPFDGGPASASLRSVILSGNDDLGINAFGASVTVEDSIIRDTLGLSIESGTGRAVNVQADPRPGDEPGEGRGELIMRRSLVENSVELAIMIGGSDGLVEDTVLRGVGPGAHTGLYGRGLSIQPFTDAGPELLSQATIRRTTVRQTRDVAVYVLDAAVELERVDIRDVAPQEADQLSGDGLAVVTLVSPQPASVAATCVRDTSRVGIASFGAELVLSASLVSCATIDLDAETVGAHAAQFLDSGDNACGCGESWAGCHVLSSSLTPPGPVGNL